MEIDRVQVKSLEEPDERYPLVRGRVDVVTVAGRMVGRATYEPGWKWSEDVGRARGLAPCPVEHVVLVLAGRMRIAMDDGSAFDVGPGDLCAIPRGHDAWVLGGERYVSLHFGGTEEYARTAKAP